MSKQIDDETIEMTRSREGVADVIQKLVLPPDGKTLTITEDFRKQ